MKSRRVFFISTIISVCLCTVMTTPAFAVNWWQVGWIVANNVIDRVVNLDGQSSNDQYSTYMVSPSIVFNNGTNGGEFYMRPQVSSRVTSFEMHAHRANPVDFGANIVLALSTMIWPDFCSALIVGRLAPLGLHNTRFRSVPVSCSPRTGADASSSTTRPTGTSPIPGPSNPGRACVARRARSCTRR